MYLAFTSVSRLTSCPILIFLNVVSAIVWGINEILNIFSSISFTVKLVPSIQIYPFTIILLNIFASASKVTIVLSLILFIDLQIPVDSTWPSTLCPPILDW